MIGIWASHLYFNLTCGKFLNQTSFCNNHTCSNLEVCKVIAKITKNFNKKKKIKERMHQQAKDFIPDKKRILRRKDVLIFLLNFG